MVENRRDVGLVRALGPWGLATSIVGIIIGAGIFALPGALAASAGANAPLAILACAIGVGAVAICFAEGGSRVPGSGGPYAYIEAAFGPQTGFIAGTLLWIGSVLACGAVSAALADVVVSLLPPAIRAPVHAIVIVGVVGGIAWVNVGGVSRGARFVGAATLLKLLPLVIFVVVGMTAVRVENFHSSTHPNVAGFGRALILAVYALSGMEAALSASGEVVNPSRNIPRALALALSFVTLVYVAIQAVAQGILGPALAGSTVPLAEAMSRISPSLRVLMLAGAALSMFGWLGSDILGTSRMWFALARDGLMPRVLGRVHPRTHAPHVAILAYAAMAIAIALTGTFVELAVLSVLASSALYILGCAAAWLLARHGVALAGAPLNVRWISGAASIGIASMLAIISLAARAELFGLLAVSAGSIVIFKLAKRSRRLPKN